ncbi:MAG TPA: PTS sugar transporter subunit IIA [Polyangiaceae bacterium]|jgi:PTS system nitrogen regulatory IIA component|nr:PTS sugar transporter subunit IIA [Polyangiaceae bacterium]
MRLTDLLTPDRVAVSPKDDAHPFDKLGAIRALAEMLSRGTMVDAVQVERVLLEREQLQSTGIGEGVAIPHGALPQLEMQHATLLIVPQGVEFAAIDGVPVNILFAVLGPKRATGEHLKTLARVSRLLRNKAFREQLIHAPSAQAAYDLIATEEGDRP